MSVTQLLAERRAEIRAIAAKHNVTNLPVLGSAACGKARPDSDIDFLIEIGAPTSAWFPAELLTIYKTPSTPRRTRPANDRSYVKACGPCNFVQLRGKTRTVEAVCQLRRCAATYTIHAYEVEEEVTFDRCHA